ncbi:hypothetical protein SALBM311S_12956 [Streptomyces alboniger]
MHDGLALVLVQPLQERGRVHRRARGAVTVVGVPVRRHVELPAEQVVRNGLRSVIVLGRRRGSLLVPARGLEVRQEAVIKEAAHRTPSLGPPTDSPPPPREHRRNPAAASDTEGIPEPSTRHLSPFEIQPSRSATDQAETWTLPTGPVAERADIADPAKHERVSTDQRKSL